MILFVRLYELIIYFVHYRRPKELFDLFNCLELIIVHDQLHVPIINEMPLCSGSPCVRNRCPLQTHLVLEETLTFTIP